MCIFCDIVEHKIPSSVVYEDDEVLAILNVPQSIFGHTLVMPKKHYANIIEADEETVLHCMKVAKMLAGELLEKAEGAKGINILNNCGEAAGQTVNHLHFHVIPRYNENDGISIQFDFSMELNPSEVLEKLK